MIIVLLWIPFAQEIDPEYEYPRGISSLFIIFLFFSIILFLLQMATLKNIVHQYIPFGSSGKSIS